MKNKIIILITSLALVAGCASAPNQPAQSCIALDFPHPPSPALIAQLAATQPDTTAAQVAAWFKSGQTSFVLSSSHTNEINAAQAEGATAEVIHFGGGVFNTLITGKR